MVAEVAFRDTDSDTDKKKCNIYFSRAREILAIKERKGRNYFLTKDISIAGSIAF